MNFVLDLLAAICLLLGALLSLAAGIGLVRFPDALSRLHAATKPQVLGLIFVVIAIALTARSLPVLLALVPVIVFQMLAAPIAAHMIGRAGYRTRNFRREMLFEDELEAAVEQASRSAGTADGPDASERV